MERGKERETKCVRTREWSKATLPCPGHCCCHKAGGSAWRGRGGCVAGDWAGSLPALSVPPHTVFPSGFGGTVSWRGSPGTIQLLLQQGSAAQAYTSKNSNPNASCRVAQSRILPKGQEHLKEIFFFRAEKELVVPCTALQLQ